MRAIWGAVKEISDLGVVAEHCPHCERLTCCLLRSVCQGNYVFFVKMAEVTRETSCMCTDCHKTFPGEPVWHYAGVVPIREAREMDLESLLAKTNPILGDRIRFKEQIRELGGDHLFVVAHEQIEGMRPGLLRSDLLQQLLDWRRLDETQRTKLGRHIASRARAWGFARQMAIGFPAMAGCLTYVVAAVMVGLVLLCVPAARSWIGGAIAAVSGLIVAAAVDHFLLTQSVRRWTRHVLIPEAQQNDVSLDCFIAVVDDVPGSKLGLTEELWPMKQHLQTICKLLHAKENPPKAEILEPQVDADAR